MKSEKYLLSLTNKIVKDLEKIEGFELNSIDPWSSNLKDILPMIGGKMEDEIKSKIEMTKMILKDQELRTKWSSLEHKPEK